MKSSLVVLLSILLVAPIFAQSQRKAKKSKVYKVWVNKTDRSTVKGYLYSANNELIKVVTKVSDSDLIEVKAIDINKIKIRRKGKIGRNTWIGGAIGAGVGATLGLLVAWGDEEAVATGSGLFFGAIGSGIGAAIGASRKTIRINGSLEMYNAELKWLQAYAIKSTSDDKEE